MSRKSATRFQSEHSGQHLNRAQKSKGSKVHQLDKPNTPKQEPMNIVDRSVLRSGLSYDSFVRLLIQSALSRLTIWTQADLDRLLMLSERLGLDPLNNEIYATEISPDSGKKARIVFVVGVDGWSKIINSHPQFDGMKFVESSPGDDELPLYFECTIFRKDRKVATSVREYMYEAHTGQGAWLTHPRRMLRHKAMVQCARICFGLSGVYDPDEAQRIQEIKTKDKELKLKSNAPRKSDVFAYKHSKEGLIDVASNLPDISTTSNSSNHLEVKSNSGEASNLKSNIKVESSFQKVRGMQYVKNWLNAYPSEVS
jgi:phage recombination protein Bet